MRPIINATLFKWYFRGMVSLMICFILYIVIGAATGRDDSYCRSGYKWVMDANGNAHQVWCKDGPVECKQ